MMPEVKLIHYAISEGLIEKSDYDYAFNRLCTLVQRAIPYVPYQPGKVIETPLVDMLEPIIDQAVSDGVVPLDTVQEKDLFEAYLMDVFTPHPSVLQKRFERLEAMDPARATDDFYHRSVKSNYIKMERIRQNISYTVPSDYGDMRITINKSKPEKDPRDIAKKETSESYPECLLCKENVGFYGHGTHPGRSNHRIIRMTLNGEPFYFQFSPYVYYDEHAIVLHESHIPMEISKKTFKRLFDFIDRFPHYFLGSNAALPIVGGSILSHEHYQGGKARFPIDRADAFYKTEIGAVSIELLNWPLSAIRLRGKARNALIETGDALRRYFSQYSDQEAGLIAKTDRPHNTINPILRKHDDTYQLLIILRNNRTTEAYPDGLFHPHPDKHHIKRENIGLIEAMGLAILPPRLDDSFKAIEQYLKGEKHDLKGIEPHSKWIRERLSDRPPETPLQPFIRSEAGKVFIEGLEDCGIFKQTPAGQTQFIEFLKGFLTWHSQ